LPFALYSDIQNLLVSASAIRHCELNLLLFTQYRNRARIQICTNPGISSIVVLSTNPNPTKSGSGPFGLGIRSVKGSESLSPDPDPGSVARFPKLTNNVGKFYSTLYLKLNFHRCPAAY
jgi:hypothetical protein